MKEPVAYIYCIRNIVNGFMYIGVTKNSIIERFEAHMNKKQSKWYRKVNRFTSDIVTYGRNNFTIELVENIYDPEIISEIEDYWINKIDKNISYNVSRSAYSVKSFYKDKPKRKFLMEATK